MLKKIQKLSSSIHSEVTDIRRYLHANPELSYQEVNTGLYISERLKDWNILHTHGIADNGVVALIEGRNPSSRVIALRGDIDALPILEAGDKPYKSKNEGVMHACGHDAHTASLLGVARILNDLKGSFDGTVKLIFQPAEEKLPGGASLMIEQGVLQNPAPSLIIGQHVHPPLPVGKVGMKAGVYMASTDELHVTVRGKGGHGAMPQDCVDTILLASHLVVALQQIVSRYANPAVPSVLTFGKITGNGATNIIPNEVRLEGTFRTMNEEWRNEAHRKMKKLAEGLCESMGGSCEFNIMRGYPVLVNHEALTHQIKANCIAYLGAENVVDLPLRMTAEDFAYYSQVIPACFYRLGTGNAAKDTCHALHTDRFDIDEDALEVGAGLMAWLAVGSYEL